MSGMLQEKEDEPEPQSSLVQLLRGEHTCIPLFWQYLHLQKLIIMSQTSTESLVEERSAFCLFASLFGEAHVCSHECWQTDDLRSCPPLENGANTPNKYVIHKEMHLFVLRLPSLRDAVLIEYNISNG